MNMNLTCGLNFVEMGKTAYLNSTYTIVSKVAFLIGIPKRVFELPHEPPRMEQFMDLEKNKHARIIRNLCMLRTAIEQNYTHINREMSSNLKNLTTLPEYVPQECIAELSADGISLYKANYKLIRYLIDINKLIMDRINNCQSLFPVWLPWQYLRPLFIMPNGLSEQGCIQSGMEYYATRSRLPYGAYMNWAGGDYGNILYNDKKFVSLLYEANENYFQDMSKVTDASDLTKHGIYDYLQNSDRTVMVVDCENSDPYKLYAVLKNLNAEVLLDRIYKIILFDDIHAASAWRILDQFTQIPIEHIMIERVKEQKSLVDIRLTAGACREFYENKVTSFIIVSSDSDYWGLISALPEAKFLVMVEYEKCGYSIKTALENSGIFYCFIDDFCTGNSSEVQKAALLREVQNALDARISININEVLQEAYYATRVDMTQKEKDLFFTRYVKTVKVALLADGRLTLQLDTL